MGDWLERLRRFFASEKIQHPLWLLFGSHRSVPQPHIRGTKRITLAEAQAMYRGATRPGAPTFLWGMCRVPYMAARRGLRITGAQGTGKTALIRMLLKDGVLNRIQAESDHRAYIYDSKGDYIRDLPGLGFKDSENIIHVHPFTSDGRAWDLARDMKDHDHADLLGRLLFPVPKLEVGGPKFFAEAEQAIITAVITSFIKHAKGKWTLRDLLLAFENIDALKYIIGLSRHPSNKMVLRDLFPKDHQELAASVRAGFIGRTRLFSTVAARWDHAMQQGRTFSLEEWAKKPSVLVFGQHDGFEEALQGIHRVLFRRMTQILLAQGNSKDRTTWVVLDELADPGKLDGLEKLFFKGRDRGVCVVLGFQELAHIQEHYGEIGARSILSLTQLPATLRIRDGSTASWIEGDFGNQQFYRSKRSTTDSPQGRSVTTSEEPTVESPVAASDMQNLPFLDPDRGIGPCGFFATVDGPVYELNMTWDELTSTIGPPPTGKLETEADEDTGLSELRPWDDDDMKRLNLPPGLWRPAPPEPPEPEKRKPKPKRSDPEGPEVNPF